ncbi:alpha-ribazole phosphatase [Pararobbsia silviterrae]|uniref:Alpha-ribazole phosphatase n=2 Tax=Pararobbsia silviterrae TaxID=1792498 RepID=A0A494Y447_9BURK|nr:alpha-ribazole phosphatase [Pararobbsia silviterrae]
MRLVLVRHPEVAIAPGICYGRSDISLKAPPTTGADRIAARVAALCAITGTRARSVRLYASPLVRCADVASALAAQWGGPLAIDSDLAELDFGRWELRPWDSIDRDALDAWAADLEHGRPHGGESVAMVGQRVERWLARASAQGAGTLVAITHAGVMRVAAARLLGEPIAESLRRPLEFEGVCCFARRTPSDRADGAANVGDWALTHWNGEDVGAPAGGERDG